MGKSSRQLCRLCTHLRAAAILCAALGLLGLAVGRARHGVSRLLTSSVEMALSRELGRPVNVGAVSIGRSGLRLEQVDLAGSSGDALVSAHARTVHVEGDPIRWWRGDRGVLSVALDGLALHVRSAGARTIDDPWWLLEPLQALGVGQARAQVVELGVRDGRGSTVLAAHGAVVALELGAERVRFHFSAEHMRCPEGAGTFQAKGTLEPGKTEIDELVVTSSDGRLAASARIDGYSAEPTLSLIADLRLSAGGVAWLAKHAAPTPLGLRASNAVLQLALRGALCRPESWLGSGSFALLDPTLTLAGAARPLELSTLDGYLLKTEQGLELRHAVARGRGFALTATADPGAAGHVAFEADFEPASSARRLLGTQQLLSFVREPAAPGVSSRAHVEGRARLERGQLRSAVGRLDVENVVLRGRGPGSRPVPVRRAELRFDHDERRTLIERFALDAPDGSVRGRARLSTASHSIELRAKDVNAELIAPLVPGTLLGGRLSGTLSVSGTAREPMRTSRGELAVSDVVWTAPGQVGKKLGPLPISTGKLKYTSANARVKLTDVVLDSPLFRARGGATLERNSHSVSVAFDRLEPALLGRFVPGHLRGGRVFGELQLVGGPDQLVRDAWGRILVAKTRWKPTAGAPFSTTGIAVRGASARFRGTPEDFSLAQVRLDTGLFSGSGSVRRRGPVTVANGVLDTPDVSKLAPLFPSLRGLFTGGTGRGVVRVASKPSGTSGQIRALVRNATLVIPALDGRQPTRHHVEKTTFDFGWTPRGQRLQGLALRGPNVNGDLSATFSQHGHTAGRGRVWLTRRYTRRTWGFFSIFPRLLGYGSPRSSFHLSGRDEDLRVNADAAHGFRWRLLRLGVSRRVKGILRGRIPLFGR